jgi:hypothetical protein
MCGLSSKAGKWGSASYDEVNSKAVGERYDGDTERSGKLEGRHIMQTTVE